MNQVVSFKERQNLLFEKSNKYKQIGYKLIYQKNHSLRMTKIPLSSKKMTLKKKIFLIKFLLFERSWKLGKRKEFIDISIDMYGNICTAEES